VCVCVCVCCVYAHACMQKGERVCRGCDGMQVCVRGKGKERSVRFTMFLRIILLQGYSELPWSFL